MEPPSADYHFWQDFEAVFNAGQAEPIGGQCPIISDVPVSTPEEVPGTCRTAPGTINSLGYHQSSGHNNQRPTDSEHYRNDEFFPDFVNGIDLIDQPGSYGFKMHVPEASPSEGQTRRAPTFISCGSVSRLYCQADTFVPLQLTTTRQLPSTIYLNLFTIFSAPAHRGENVQVCAYHQGVHKNLNHPEFLVRASDNENAEYLSMDDSSVGPPPSGQSSDSARHVLRLVLPPRPGKCTVVRVKFMCRNSCQGGINRRATTLVGVLTTPSNAVLGVSYIPIKIVSSPARDVRRELGRTQQEPVEQAPTGGSNRGDVIRENTKSKNNNNGSSSSNNSNKIKGNKLVCSKSRESSDADLPDVGGNSSDTEEIFTIYVKGEKNAKMLMMMAEGLELRHRARKRRKPAEKDALTTNSSSSTSSSNTDSNNNNYSNYSHHYNYQSNSTSYNIHNNNNKNNNIHCHSHNIHAYNGQNLDNTGPVRPHMLQ